MRCVCVCSTGSDGVVQASVRIAKPFVRMLRLNFLQPANVGVATLEEAGKAGVAWLDEVDVGEHGFFLSSLHVCSQIIAENREVCIYETVTGIDYERKRD